MKSSKARYWLFALLLIVIASALVFLRTERNETRSPVLSPTPNTALSQESTATTTNQTSDPIFDKIKSEREEKLRDIANTAIDFFGKVVDEKGNPIEGATTFYIVGSLSFYGSPTVNGPKTDADGLFSITGKRGPDFSVWVEHPDYYKTDSSDRNVEYARREYMPGKEPPLPPTSGNPTIFVLRKKGIAEPLIHHQEIRTRVPFGESPTSINVRSGQPGQAGESIVITMKSEGDKLPLNTFRPFNWSVIIEVPGGGLVKRLNALDFQAPEDGYVPQITVNMPASLPRDDWNAEMQQEYFVSFGSGNYGRVRLDVSGLKGRCIAETFLNPNTGSRNLEFDPAKVVKSQ